MSETTDTAAGHDNHEDHHDHDDHEDHDDHDDEIVMPAMLEAARSTYGMAMRRALLDGGFDDMPRRGMGVVGGIARNGPAAQQDLTRYMTISKQTVSQLVDQLVIRGYVDRTPDDNDRRRMMLTLTERGQAAAALTAGAVAKVDAAIARRFSANELATTRRVLGALYEIGERARARARAATATTTDDEA